MQNFSTHIPPKQSTPQWQGLSSAKFQVGRFHQNHPSDELDTLMKSAKSIELPSLGKKQFQSQRRETKQIDQRPKLRTFDQKYKRSTVFDVEDITKLIKVPFNSEKDAKKNIKLELNSKYNYNTIGTSKIKAMQEGLKQTGIYRNFYNSQARSLHTLQTLQ